MNINRFTLPKTLSDARLDTMLAIFDSLRIAKKTVVKFSRNNEITPAGMAILCLLIDAYSESENDLTFLEMNLDIAEHLKLHQLFILAQSTKGFVDVSHFQFQENNCINWAKVSSISPEFLALFEKKFTGSLTEDQIWTVQLILNELMQNAVDHSTSERYFMYCGVNQGSFEFGVLDRGVSIPAKLSVKYLESFDHEYIEKSLERDVGTRRNRRGGMGLFYLFENLKDEAGKLVIISRNGQVRRHFGSRNAISKKNKTILYGTWCLARIPLEKK